MGQGTMTLRECAQQVEDMSVEHLGREAYEGRLRLHPLPECQICGCADGEPCRPGCEEAGTQIVWIGDWLAWHQANAASPRQRLSTEGEDR